LALGILAMTVGLIRGESAGDLRTLTRAMRPPASTGRSRQPPLAAAAAGCILAGREPPAIVKRVIE
jgi:hypothetical protein